MTIDERPCTYIDSPDGLGQLLTLLERESSIALDTESNSFHAYVERVCLIQLSTESADFALDPFKVDVAPLGALLADPAREIVVHAADYDIRCMKRDFGFRIARLFDTMLAAKTLGHPEVGLAALVHRHFGVALAKANQRSDWGRRPLSLEQLAYAFTDTRYLLPLRRILQAELEQAGKTQEARRSFDRQARCEPREKRFDREGYRRIRGFRELGPLERAVVRALYLAREECARSSNRPPFKIYGDETLLALAVRKPATLEELAAVKGLGDFTVRKHGAVLLEAIAGAANGSDTSAA